MTPVKRLFITGGSGFIGSHLAGALAEEGHLVRLLIRPSGQRNAKERWNRIADWLKLTPDARGRVSVFSGNLTDPGLNLSPEDRRHLKNHTEEVIHAAASTSFSERKRDEAIRTNITGLENLLSFLEEGSRRRLHLISTAYVAGRAQSPCLESFSNPSGFFNPYEETKHRAEFLVQEFCRRMSIQLCIYRPAIVYGSSTTGRTFRFNALYHPVRSVAYLRDLFRKDLAENSGLQARKLGIFQDPDGSALHMPIRLNKKRGTGLNLVPIDYCIAAILEIMKAAGTEGIFHITNTKPTPLEDLVSFAGKFLNVTGMRVECAAGKKSTAPGPLDQLFRRYMEPYQSYIEDTRSFDDSRAAKTLAPAGNPLPDFFIFHI